MKRLLTAALTAGLVVAGVGLAAPASADVVQLTNSKGGLVCEFNRDKTARTASAAKGSCVSVKSKIGYRDNGGTLRYTQSTSWSSATQVTAATSMVVYRYSNTRYKLSGTTTATGWLSY